MVWYVGGNEKISKGIRNLDTELRQGSDRAVAIIAGSLVETALTGYLQRSVQVHGDMWKNRTHSSGPLGSFSMKIDVLYMFRFLTLESHGDLVLMKDIRNKFAHDLEITDFETPLIRDKCMHLKLVDKYVIDSDAIVASTVTHVAGESTFGVGGKGALEEIKKPRERYIWSARVFAMGLGMRPFGMSGAF
jgi:hypothetical protein